MLAACCALASIFWLPLQNQPHIQNEFPAWSPDGSKIAFMSDRDGGDIEIYVMNADGSHQMRLTHAPGRDAHPSWSRDGAQIYFQSPREGGREQVYVMDADGANQRRLTHNIQFSGVPLSSPDGRRIRFMINEAPSLDVQHWQIYVMDAVRSRVFHSWRTTCRTELSVSAAPHRSWHAANATDGPSELAARD